MRVEAQNVWLKKTSQMNNSGYPTQEPNDIYIYASRKNIGNISQRSSYVVEPRQITRV